MGLSILITADPQIPVPPRFYGGIERIIALLIEGLVARDHDVTLVAHRDSRVPCQLVPYSTDGGSASDCARQAATIGYAALQKRPDIIQSFSRLASLLAILPSRTPKVMSYQREITPRAVRRAARIAAGTLTFTGCSHRLIEPVRNLAQWDVIYNAVPIDRFVYSARVPADAPVVFLGRLEPVKGPHLAIEAARAADRRLVIAGNVPGEHEEFFRTQILPAVDGQRVSYIGPVDDVAKVALLGNAAAFLMPVTWDEPFGIVMAEALACGTPVIGLDRGAVPEVVRDGETGFVCNSVPAMVTAIGRIGAISRADCRTDAERRFSGQALTDQYERLFFRRLQAREMSPAAAL